jgi:DNA-binding Xre family transcriptional regulator
VNTINTVILSNRNGVVGGELAIVRGAMIALNVADPAKREGIDNANMLAITTGLSYETCRKLWRGTAMRIDLKTIERLCDVLRCRPGQLFDYEYEPNKPRRKRRVDRSK